MRPPCTDDSATRGRWRCAGRTCAGPGRARASPRTSTHRASSRIDLATIAWLADQEWSNGNVGMFGTSYSGFNSLQVAALQPPALKAIIPIYATDRRYTDDVHYGGGVMRGIDFLDYPMLMVAMNALPPVPSVFGDGWREEWIATNRRDRAVVPPVARTPARGRVLATRIGVVRRLRGDRSVDDDHRRSRRRLPQHGLQRLRAAAGAEATALRSLEPHESQVLDAGAADRPRARDDPVVASMVAR